MKILKLMLAVIAVMMVIVGGIWILQGLNILPGSFMTGRMEWAWRGGALAIVGIGLFWLARRK